MYWKFILEQEVAYVTVQTVIEDPVGWNDAVFQITRDRDLHGVFFQYSASLKFYGEAYDLINAEYLLNGVEGEMRLIIQFACSDTDEFEDFYTSKINFSKIEFENSQVCLVSCPIEDDTALTLLKNRQDQKVDIESLESFDGEPLDAYGALPITLSLTPKTIIKTDEYLHASNPVEAEFNYSTAAGLQTFTSYIYLKGIDQIEEINGLPDDYVEGFTDTENDVLPLYHGVFIPNIGVWQLDLQYNVRLEISLSLGNGTVDGCDPIDRFTDVAVTLILRRLRGVTYEYFTVGSNSFTDCYNNTDNRFIEELSYGYSGVFPFPVLGGEFVAGDDVSLYLKVEVSGTYSIVSPGPITYDVVASVFDHGDSFFKVTVPTIFLASDAEVCLINEVLSRTAEAITNDELRVYSEYFGRTDSEPYSTIADGDGSLEAVTTGLKIRRNVTTLMKWSFKEIYDGLNHIHNIGMGLEDDLNYGRPVGQQLIRIEPARYFYDDEVILICDKVPNVTRRVLSEEHYSITNIGYAKWEAEEYNGLDEFNTKREYRTTLKTVKNTLTHISNFIASGYAIEITRQQYLGVSKDWRFDNDTFIICLLRSYGDFIVEQGNIGSPANLIDPDTVYNFRISPNRNLLRWLWKILSSYVDPLTGEVIFMDGEGNYLAEGLMPDSVEAAVLSESESPITDSTMDVPADGLPVYVNEEWSFDYPMSVDDYHAVKANPRGLISVRYGQNTTFVNCYIRQIEYKPVKGLAQFTLLPKYPFGSGEETWYLLQETGFPILQEDGDHIILEH